MGRLDGKVVVVTGASRGIGADIARLFASEGGRVVCAARTLQEGQHPLAGSLETTVAGIREAGGEAHAVAANIAEPAGVRAADRGGAPALRPGGRAGQQRGADLLHPGEGLPGRQVAALLGRELPGPVRAEPARAPGHDRPQERRHREHLLGLRDRPRARALPRPRGGRSRRHLLRRREGRARALHPGPGLRGVPVRDLGDVARALAGRAHARHRVPPARERPRRPARRAAAPDGAGRAAAGHRAGRAGERPRDLQPADPPRVRLDRDGAAAAGWTRAAAATRRSSSGRLRCGDDGAGSRASWWWARRGRASPSSRSGWPPGSARSTWSSTRSSGMRTGPRPPPTSSAPASSARPRGPAGSWPATTARVRDLLWPRADTIVWLDYAFPLVLRRLAARTVRRAVTGEVLWNGNREYFWEHCRLWSEKSLFHWLFKTYWAYRRELPVLFAQPAHAHLRIARLRRPREAEAWLAGLAPE